MSRLLKPAVANRPNAFGLVSQATRVPFLLRGEHPVGQPRRDGLDPVTEDVEDLAGLLERLGLAVVVVDQQVGGDDARATGSRP